MAKIAIWLVIAVITLTTLNCAIMILVSQEQQESMAYLGLTLLAMLLLAPTMVLLHKPGYGTGGLVLCGGFLLSWLGLIALMTKPEFLKDHFEDVGLSVTAIFFMGLPTGIAMMVINKPWGKWFGGFASVVGITGIALTLVAIWMPHQNDDQNVRERLAQTALFGFGIFMTTAVLLINVGQRDRRYFRWAVVLAGLATFIVIMMPIWAPKYSNSWEVRQDQERAWRNWYLATWLLWTLVGTVGLVNMLLMTWRIGAVRVLKWIAVALVSITGITVAYGFFAQMQDWQNVKHEGYPKLLGFLGTLTVGAITTMLAARTMLRLKKPPPPPEYNHLTLHCPNCGQVQPMGLAGACATCLLQFKITLTDPRCPACDHLLLNLTSDRCPKCGTAIQRPAPVTVPAPVTPAPPAC